MAINTIKATIQMRKGLERDFDADQMTAGEWAVSTDTKYVRMCFAPGIVLRMATYEGFEIDMEEIRNTLKECQDIQVAVDAMAKLAEKHKNDSEKSAKLSESWAKGETGVRAGENTNNSKYFSGLAEALVAEAEKLLDQAQKVITASTQGALIPGGTVAFADLPLNPAIGYMYNISNDFTTDERFEDGAGIFYRAGANVYWTSGGKWDVLIGTQVTGVKGAKETSYRVGNVNLTPANIGAVSSDSVDSALSKTSTNPIQNKPVATQFEVLENNTWSLSGGASIPMDADLNDYIEIGNYYSSSASVTNTLQNVPPVSSGFDMKVYHSLGRGVWLSQTIVFNNTGGITYTRSGYLNDGAMIWYGWRTYDIPLINNLTTSELGKGALDAYYGSVLKEYNRFLPISLIGYASVASESEMETLLDSLSQGEGMRTATFNKSFAGGIINPGGRVFVISFNTNENYCIQFLIVYYFNSPSVIQRIKQNGVWNVSEWYTNNLNKNNYQSLTQFTDIPEGADLKSGTYLVSGNYCCSQNKTIATLLNCPVEEAFVLCVEYATGKSSHINQTFKTYKGDVIVKRTFQLSSSQWLGEYRYVGGGSVKVTIPKISENEYYSNIGIWDVKFIKIGNVVMLTMNIRMDMKAVNEYVPFIDVPSGMNPANSIIENFISQEGHRMGLTVMNGKINLFNGNENLSGWLVRRVITYITEE